jgi:chromosome partitioning protein
MDELHPEGTEPAAMNDPAATRTPWKTREGRVISFISRKGGVGKTTSAVNLGAALALSGHEVLVIGTDPQCGVCRTLGASPEDLPAGLGDVWERGTLLVDLAQPSALPGLSFVSPQVLGLDEEEDFLDNLEREPELFVIGVDRARARFDTILIDCPSSLGPATRAALLASDGFLVPIQAEELCRNSIDPLLEFVDTFRERSQAPRKADIPNLHNLPVRTRKTPLVLEGIFLTMESTHTNMGRHVAARVTEDFGDLVFRTSIPRTIRLSEMALRGKPAVIYDRRSAGSRAYFDLADELVGRYRLARESMGLSEGDAIPERDDPLAGPETGEEPAPAPPLLGDKLGGGGLETFLADLVGREAAGDSAPPAEAAPAGPDADPEIVSLDDLLAEEEDREPGAGNDEDWEAGFWSLDSDDSDRLN